MDNTQQDDEWNTEEEQEEEEDLHQQAPLPLFKNEEESKVDPSWIPTDQIKHCKHYIRWCEKKAPCCGIFYPCRLCHNELFQGIKGPGCLMEVMPRQQVSCVRCKRCLTEQAPSKNCVNCNIVFARYFCSVCKFYDDNPTKKIYHCDKCKMCRIGTKEDNFHCEICNICLNLDIKPTHKCTENAFVQNCPICQMNLKESVDGVQQMKCGHWIHVDCLNSYISISLENRCPVCNTALQKMSKGEINMYDNIVEQSKGQLPKEVQDMRVSIQCLECHQESKDLPYHFYLKCSHCGSYNTKQ